jgi:hypothetical protein
MSKMNISSEFKKINIISCLEEISATGLDNENTSIRPHKCDGKTYLGIDVFKKTNPYYKGICTDKNKNNSHLCTYGNKLAFVYNKPEECNSDMFWDKIVNFVNNKNNKKKQHFFFVTHHNRLKKTIFKSILDTSKKNKRHFANCCSIKLYHDGVKWILKIIFKGFPDKNLNYFGEKNQEVEVLENTVGILQNAFQPFMDKLEDIKNKNVSLMFIRHGNAFHNSPLKTTGKGFLGTMRNIFSRTTDSCLTPLGIYQARQVGKILKSKKEIFQQSIQDIFSASYMNRAQQTMLEIMFGADEEIFSKHYTNLYDFQEIFLVYALSRLYRIITKKNSWDNWKLDKKWKKTLFTLSEHKEINSTESKKKFDKMMEISEDVHSIIKNNGTTCIKYLEKKLGTIRLYPLKTETRTFRKGRKYGKLNFDLKQHLPPKPTPYNALKMFLTKQTKKNKHKKKTKQTKKQTKKIKGGARGKRRTCKKRMKKKIICFRASNKKVTKKLLKLAKKIRKTKKINLSRCSKYRLQKWRKTKKK